MHRGRDVVHGGHDLVSGGQDLIYCQAAVTKPSTEWPFQRFSWTDHEANSGDTVSYRIIPILRNSSGKLERLDSHASEWSPPRTLGVTAGEDSSRSSTAASSCGRAA